MAANERKNMKISIAGELGSGKSSVSKVLARKKGMHYFSTGAIQRDIASKLGVSTLELNKISENDKKIDDQIDSFLVDLNKSQNSIIIDSRMAWHFVPSSFKVFLYVDINVAAERVIKDKERTSESYDDIVSAKNDLESRKSSENKRFFDLYNVNCSNFDNYDLVVDTSLITPDEAAVTILRAHERWKKNEHYSKTLLSPKILYPTHGVTQIGWDIAKNLCNTIKEIGYDEKFPIHVIKDENFFYIYDGHKRVSSAIFNDIKLIPSKILATDEDEILSGVSVHNYVINETSLSMIYDWEDCHNFHFHGYPAR